MRTPPLGICIPVVLLAALAVGCGSDDDSTVDTNAVVVTTNAPPATLDVPLGTDDIPLTPVNTADIPPLPVVSSDIAAPITIKVTVGVDSSPERVEVVPLGSNVVLSITDPTSDDEFHLHGYDLGDGVSIPAGQAETFTFVANQAGEFEVESHETGDVLMILSVG